MKKAFPEEYTQEIEKIFQAYPTREAALLPLLHLAQKALGYIDDETMEILAEMTGVTPAKVKGVMSFYTMYHPKPCGKTHIRVCTNISCMLRGGYEVLNFLKEKLNISPGEVTSDQRFSLEEVECLGACDQAPVIMVNDHYQGPVTFETLEGLLKEEG